MTDKTTGGPAFPVGEEALMRNLQGMTLRDYFAVKAMQAYWLDPEIDQTINAPENVARWSYEMADAMLGARK